MGNEAITSNGKGKSYGVEALYQQKLAKNFYGVFAYTYFHSQFTTSKGKFLPSVWDSRHLISFSGGYKLKRNWEISARWRFSGLTPYVPVDLDGSLAAYPEIVLDYSELGNAKLDPFNLADIALTKNGILKVTHSIFILKFKTSWLKVYLFQRNMVSTETRMENWSHRIPLFVLIRMKIIIFPFLLLDWFLISNTI